jgi:hypothetical protein
MIPNGTPTLLLLTICEAMGLPSVTSFRNPKFCADGPIEKLVA